MITKLAVLLRYLLRQTIATLRLVGRRWPLWLASALLGAMLGGLGAAALPPRWASEGDLYLRPTFILEGYLLATNELSRHYAVRLVEPERLARVMARHGIAQEPTALRAASAAGAVVHLRVEHPRPEAAEAIARGLLVDLRGELEAENRTREESDRLVVALSPTSFPRSATPRPARVAMLGAAGGALAGIVAILLASLWQRGRIALPLEAERLVGAPTLGAIPRRRWR